MGADSYENREDAVDMPGIIYKVFNKVRELQKNYREAFVDMNTLSIHKGIQSLRHFFFHEIFHNLYNLSFYFISFFFNMN